MEGGTATEAAIDRLIAAQAAQMAADRVEEAKRFRSAGAYRVAQPMPELTLPEAAQIPLELPASFAGFERDVAYAQSAADRAGFGDAIHGVFGLLAGVEPHEGTPATATPEQRMALADRAVDALIDRHGEERGGEIAAAWKEAVQTLGLGRFVRARGLDTIADVVDHVGLAWLTRVPGRPNG
jgi:hypothetical protein